MARTKKIVTKIQNEIEFLALGFANHPESYNVYCNMIKDIRATISGLYYMDVLSESDFHGLCEFFNNTVCSVGMSYFEANYPYFDGKKE